MVYVIGILLVPPKVGDVVKSLAMLVEVIPIYVRTHSRFNQFAYEVTNLG